MGYSVLITGSTGMVGKGVLYECMEHGSIDRIILINRKSVGISSPKITELIHQDFTDFSSIASSLKNLDACYFCLGVSALGMSESDYSAITYDITMTLAKSLLKLNPDMIFCYVSGAGTNINGRSTWARVKGKTEQDLSKLTFKKVILFRPGLIQPLRGIKAATQWYNTIYIILNPFMGLIKAMAGDSITNTTNLGLAMIGCLLVEDPPVILDNKKINQLASKITNR
jgi:uncharacterized protein YbjT (DUF2867 family)